MCYEMLMALDNFLYLDIFISIRVALFYNTVHKSGKHNDSYLYNGCFFLY